jgi:hypothetical protein
MLLAVVQWACHGVYTFSSRLLLIYAHRASDWNNTQGVLTHQTAAWRPAGSSMSQSAMS